MPVRTGHLYPEFLLSFGKLWDYREDARPPQVVTYIKNNLLRFSNCRPAVSLRESLRDSSGDWTSASNVKMSFA